MMKLKRGNEYVAIKPSALVCIDGQVGDWVPKYEDKMNTPWRKNLQTCDYVRMVLRIDSPIRNRIRMKLSGNFKTGHNTYVTKNVFAWIDDLIFFKVDFDKKKVYRVSK